MILSIAIKIIIRKQTTSHVLLLMICLNFISFSQANNYNVEVSSKGCGDEGMDSMSLKLLSKKQHHENMAEYRAPSVENKAHWWRTWMFRCTVNFWVENWKFLIRRMRIYSIPSIPNLPWMGVVFYSDMIQWKLDIKRSDITKYWYKTNSFLQSQRGYFQNRGPP